MYDGMDEYGIPYGVKMPRRQPATWFALTSAAQTPVTIGDANIATFSQWVWLDTLPAAGSGNERYCNSLWRATPTQLIPLVIGAQYWYPVQTTRTWMHFVFYKALRVAESKIWQNGVIVPFTGMNIRAFGANLYWGNSLGLGLGITGVTRECYYYNRQLSDAEALAIYQGNPPADYVSYWRGNGNDDAAWRDQKGTNHGTVYGSPERCLVHRRGDVLRWNGSAWYVVE